MAKQIRVGALDTPRAIRTELGRLYRAARRGDLDTLDARRLADILNMIRQAIVADPISVDETEGSNAFAEKIVADILAKSRTNRERRAQESAKLNGV